MMFGLVGSKLVSKAGICNYTVSVGCNYFPRYLIPASGKQVFVWCRCPHDTVLNLNCLISKRNKTEQSSTSVHKSWDILQHLLQGTSHDLGPLTDGICTMGAMHLCYSFIAAGERNGWWTSRSYCLLTGSYFTRLQVHLHLFVTTKPMNTKRNILAKR